MKIINLEMAEQETDQVEVVLEPMAEQETDQVEVVLEPAESILMVGCGCGSRGQRSDMVPL